MLTITAQQAAFYAQNGFLELEGVFSPEECEALRLTIAIMLQSRQGSDLTKGRDVWRDAPLVKTTVLSKKIKNIVFGVAQKPSLRLAADQWFQPGFTLKRPEKIERLFSIQGLVCALFIQLDPRTVELPSKGSPLGISPFPKELGSVLLVKPSLLINWPPAHGLYCVTFCLPTSVYIQNPLDEANSTLRKLGYGFGDLLRTETHPMLSP